MLYRNVLIAILMGLSSAPGISQEPPKSDGQIVVTPEMIEQGKRRFEILRNPYFMILEISDRPHSGLPPEKVVNKTYKSNEQIRFQLFVRHTLTEPLDVTATDIYDQIRPALFWEGQVVPYKKSTAELVEIKDKRVEVFREIPIRLESGKPCAMEIIDVADWYRPLEPGHYVLSVRRRFVWGGGWAESESVAFEVVPK